MSMAYILLVEDEPSLVKALGKRLEISGYEVQTAGNGKEALRLMAEKRPDLAIVDLMMPLMNGWELCHRMRTAAELKSIPVIMLSGSIDGSAVAGKLDECDYLMGKPFNSEELLAKIQELLGRGPSAPPPPPDAAPAG
jgi:DNA-binding response OmpR family regulator